ncbi:ankyrin [Apiospora saccharicola]
MWVSLIPKFLFIHQLIEPTQRLRRAVCANDALLVQRILKSHPQLLHNPDTSYPLGLSNSNLHLAASLGHLQICKVLVALGHEGSATRGTGAMTGSPPQP